MRSRVLSLSGAHECRETQAVKCSVRPHLLPLLLLQLERFTGSAWRHLPKLGRVRPVMTDIDAGRVKAAQEATLRDGALVMRVASEVAQALKLPVRCFPPTVRAFSPVLSNVMSVYACTR